MNWVRKLTAFTFFFAVAASAADKLTPMLAIMSGSGFQFECGPILSTPDRFEHYGSRYVFKSDPRTPGKRTLAEHGKLKVVSYNMENLVEKPGKFLTENGKPVMVNGRQSYQYGPIQKSEAALASLRRNLESEDPDVVVGIEIGSLRAMQIVFGDRYFVFLIPPSVKGSVNMGFMVKRELAVDIEVQSHVFATHDYFGVSEEAFPKDFPVVSFRDPGSLPGSDPVFILGATHLKAQVPRNIPKVPEGPALATMSSAEVQARIAARERAIYLNEHDANSGGKRSRQVVSMVGILGEYDARYGGRVPIFVAGDFNANVHSAADFHAFALANYTEAFRAKHIDVTNPDLVSTCSYFEGASFKRGDKFVSPDVAGIHEQLDAFYALGGSTHYISDAHVVPEVDEHGNALAPPRTLDELVNTRGSDHRPISMTLDLSNR
jgi:hypothetical protein